MTLTLGWAAEGVTPPEGIAARPLPGLTLLTAPATDARGILRLQQMVFDAGVDFLPVAPSRPCPVELAACAAPDRLEALRARLDALRGMAQFSIQLQWDEAISDGTWLARRRSRNLQAEAARLWLATLVEGLSSHSTPVTLRGSSAVAHLLAPRSAPPCPDLSGAPGTCLTLIGPWPPHAFTEAA